MVQECLTLGFFDTPVHEAAAAAVLRVLEAHGVMEVELITGEHAAMSQELCAGEIDIFTTVWAPDVHKDLLASVSSMQAIGNLYQPSLFLALPNKFKDFIVSVDQLKTASEIDKEVIVPETIYDRLQLIFKAYGLLDVGYSLKAIPDEAAISQYQDIINVQTNKIIALYSPSFLENSEMLYQLQDLRNLLCVEQKAVILVKKELINSLGSDLIDELEEMMLSNQVIRLMEQAMRIDGMDAHEAAEAWQRGKLVVRA